MYNMGSHQHFYSLILPIVFHVVSHDLWSKQVKQWMPPHVIIHCFPCHHWMMMGFFPFLLFCSFYQGIHSDQFLALLCVLSMIYKTCSLSHVVEHTYETWFQVYTSLDHRMPKSSRKSDQCRSRNVFFGHHCLLPEDH